MLVEEFLNTTVDPLTALSGISLPCPLTVDMYRVQFAFMLCEISCFERRQGYWKGQTLRHILYNKLRMSYNGEMWLVLRQVPVHYR